MIRTCICEDNIADREALQDFARHFSKMYPAFALNVDTFSSGYELLECIEKNGGYDLYLLDVLMPHLTGIEIAQKIRERGEPGEILFITISREYAVEAFGVKAAGYLLKPVQQDAFVQQVLDCVKKIVPGGEPAILLKTREGVRKVLIRDLAMIESFNHSRVCTLADGTALETSATLSALRQALEKYPFFFAPHRAYIINLAYVNGLTSTDLVMMDGRQIPIARKKYTQLKEAYMDYMFGQVES